MKKFIFKSLLITALFIGFTDVSQAQAIFVKVRPVAPVVVRPPAPSPQHIWIADEWEWRGGVYVRVPGYWEAPHPHEFWVTGHWRRAYGGWRWQAGHWRPR